MEVKGTEKTSPGLPYVKFNKAVSCTEIEKKAVDQGSRSSTQKNDEMKTEGHKVTNTYREEM